MPTATARGRGRARWVWPVRYHAACVRVGAITLFPKTGSNAGIAAVPGRLRRLSVLPVWKRSVGTAKVSAGRRITGRRP